MAVTAKPIFVQTVLTEEAIYTNADSAATAKTLYTAGADGGLVNAISVTSDDTSDVNLQVFITPNGGTTNLIGTITIPALSGTTAALPAISLLANANFSIFTQADGSLPVEGLGVLEFSNVEQVTSAKTLTIVGYCGDY